MHTLLAAAESAANDIEITETLIVALMLVGLALGISGTFSALDLTSELILLVFLPPLLFEGATNLDLDDLVLRWRQVAVLALGGTAISTTAIALFLVGLPGVPVQFALVMENESGREPAERDEQPDPQ